jgi:putative ABC transport system substrate-binding protein
VLDGRLNRRAALRALLASAAALAIPATGQTRIRRIVSLTSNAEKTVAEALQGFRNEMNTLGYQEGRDITLSFNYGEFSREGTARLAAAAIASKPDLIYAQHGAVHAFAKLTKTIPIVAVYSGDMIEAGLVTSLARPGGNITGVQLMNNELVGKRIEVLKEILPSVKRLAVLAWPGHTGLNSERDATMSAAAKLDLSASFYPVSNTQEIDAALAAARAAGADSLLLFPDPVTLAARERIATFALKHRMPLVSGWDNYALAGGLLTYGPNLGEAWRRAANYVDRILKGAAPSSLPIEMPTLFELVVNLKTAKALGIKIPQTVLVRADRVIE